MQDIGERGNPCFQRAGSLVKEMIINQISTKIITDGDKSCEGDQQEEATDEK